MQDRYDEAGCYTCMRKTMYFELTVATALAIGAFRIGRLNFKNAIVYIPSMMFYHLSYMRYKEAERIKKVILFRDR